MAKSALRQAVAGAKSLIPLWMRTGGCVYSSQHNWCDLRCGYVAQVIGVLRVG
jgi:hypothetical protein